ncbi:MAG: hypothetical protein M3132_10880, partial [Actinomycetia bacterium]|nr:hypothetical protein [Actinomycetes bacterium]
LPEVIGDGRRTLERLILDDQRAVCMARVYMDGLAERLFELPAEGERVRLVELGTHSLGAIFRDGNHLITPELERRIDEIARRFKGFHFGRFDLRAVSERSLREGREFKILELNGLTGEAAHIYDARYSVREAWRILGQQWADAFAIADANLVRGAKAAPHAEVAREILRFLGGNLP